MNRKSKRKLGVVTDSLLRTIGRKHEPVWDAYNRIEQKEAIEDAMKANPDCQKLNKFETAVCEAKLRKLLIGD